MALSEIYGSDKVARAIEDAFQFAAFGSDYIANILEQRERLTVQPGPLHLTRRQDLLDVELTPVDISIYPSSSRRTKPSNNGLLSSTAIAPLPPPCSIALAERSRAQRRWAKVPESV
jgi:hypothetical protein